MINIVCGIRSTGRICTDLATALEAQGHEVKIAYGRESVPEQFQKYAVKIGTDLDVKLHGVKARLLDGAGFGSKVATEKFIKWVKEYDPDIIHLHNIHGYYINVEGLFKYLKTCGKKVIWTLHDCWSFTGHTAYCDAAKCKRWVKGCHDCPLLNEYPASKIDRSKQNWRKKKDIFTGVPNMTIVTPSKWLGTWVKNSFLKDYPVKVINNGIDTSQFYPIESDFRKKNDIEDKFVLLGVATSWDKMKGYPDYLELANRLGNDFKVVLVGLTKEQMEKLPSNVLGIERTANVQELAEIYTASDLFVNLSYCENYPTVNIEAMACGTPVLTYKTGGSPEIVIENNGYVVEQGNIGEVERVVRELSREKELTVSLDKEKYDNATATKKYIKLFSNFDTFQEKMKILFLTNVPSPYRVEFFNELGRLCELTVLYQKASSSERDSKWVATSENTFKSIVLKGKSTGVDNAICPSVIKFLNKSYDAIIICGNASPTEMLAIKYCQIKRIPYCLEGDGAFVKNGNGIKEIIKKNLISGGNLFFSTCEEHDKYYIHYGADKRKIRRYRFSSLRESDLLKSVISDDDKKKIRDMLGMKEEKIVLAVGQFIPRKGFDILLSSFKAIRNDTGLYIVGGEPTEDYISFVEKNNLSNVHFVGFKTKQELAEYYRAANIFVLPTREDIWGLVINEAMAYGLPVITTDRCNAGLELIEDGENGYIVPVENFEELTKAIIKCFENLNTMGNLALTTISSYTIEQMAKDHIRILNDIRKDS